MSRRDRSCYRLKKQNKNHYSLSVQEYAETTRSFWSNKPKSRGLEMSKQVLLNEQTSWNVPFIVSMGLIYPHHKEHDTVFLAPTKTPLGAPWVHSRSQPTLQLNKSTLFLELTSSWRYAFQVQSWLSFFYFLVVWYKLKIRWLIKKIFSVHIKSVLNLEALSNALVCKLGICLP